MRFNMMRGPEPAPYAPGQSKRKQRQSTQNKTNRVGFDDIANDFMGVDQVIDGNEVIARAEFIPEGPFTGRVEQHDEDPYDGARQQQPAERWPPIDPIRHQKQKQRQRNEKVAGCNQIKYQAQAEYLQQVDQSGLDSTAGLDQQCGAGQQSDTQEDQEKQPQGPIAMLKKACHS